MATSYNEVNVISNPIVCSQTITRKLMIMYTSWYSHFGNGSNNTDGQYIDQKADTWQRTLYMM